jgi:hypothetical protein
MRCVSALFRSRITGLGFPEHARNYSRWTLLGASAYPLWPLRGDYSLSSAFTDRSMARIFWIAHYDVVGTEILLDGIVVVELSLLKLDSSMMYVVPTVGGDCVD